MTILSTEGYKTFYTHDTNELSRPIDNKQYRIDLKDNDTVGQVARLANLDNETFKLLANLQTTKKGLADD